MATPEEGYSQTVQGYMGTVWDYKMVQVHENKILETLATEEEGGWECVCIVPHASTVYEYLVILHSRKTMMGI